MNITPVACIDWLQLVDAARHHGVRFGYVAVDGGYGKDLAFLRGLAARSVFFVADVHKHQRIWLEDPSPTDRIRQPAGLAEQDVR